jgi:hypothetical protein
VAVVGIGWTPNSPTERQGLLCEMTDTSLPHAFLRNLLLNEGDEEVPPSSGGGFGGGEFDHKVFWSVNAFIVVLLIGSCAWCYCYGGGKAFCLGSMNRTQSDQEYQRAVLQRRQREAEQTKDSPEKRKRKLAQSFQRNQVGMVRTIRWCSVQCFSALCSRNSDALILSFPDCTRRRHNRKCG